MVEQLAVEYAARKRNLAVNNLGITVKAKSISIDMPIPWEPRFISGAP